MSTTGSSLAGTVVVVGALLCIAGFVGFRAMSRSAIPPVAAPALAAETSVAAEEGEWKTWEIPALVSPEQSEPGADRLVSDLIARHNANQDLLTKVRFEASCVWMLDMPGDPRPMTIEYERAGGRATMNCDKDRGRIEGSTVHMSPGSAINVDALYLLMFRKYNAKAFQPASPATQLSQGKSLIAAKSDRETVLFDQESGRLVQAEFVTEQGLIRAKFADFKPIGPDGKAFMPTALEVVVPVDLFPFERTREGTITLRIDPSSVKLREQAAK